LADATIDQEMPTEDTCIMEQNNCYDIILCYTNFRWHNYFLNIIKSLKKTYRIGLYFPEINVAQKAKFRKTTAETDKLYLSKCIEFGAISLTNKTTYKCHLLLLPQERYKRNAFDSIKFTKAIALQRFGLGSLGIDTFKKVRVKALWVYDKKVFKNIISSEKHPPNMDGINIIEMGTPYLKDPAIDFTDLKLDYLIAYPTNMLLRSPEIRCNFLESLYKLINLIPKNNVIALKKHNVRDGGHPITRNGSLISRLDTRSKLFLNALCDLLLNSKVNKYLLSKLSNKLFTLKSMIFSSLIEKQSILLSDLSDYHNFGIEHFLPYVKKGVITGVSSCIWHSLYNRVPVYNCDSQDLDPQMPGYSVYEKFYIPTWNNQIEFDFKNFNKISSGNRESDLITLIKNEF
jgi:hypothetical protein